MTIEEATESIQLFRAAVAYMRSSGKPVPDVLGLADLYAEKLLPQARLCRFITLDKELESDVMHVVPRITEVPR